MGYKGNCRAATFRGMAGALIGNGRWGICSGYPADIVKGVTVDEVDADTTDEFLVELSKLSKKYGIYVGGCGCCGSPFLENERGTPVAINVMFDRELGMYRMHES